MRLIRTQGIITMLGLLLSLSANAQFLTQSAEGKSSIPFPLNGLGVGFDITKAEIALGINNYQAALDGKRNHFIGLNIIGKNSDGIGSLFSGGDIVPEGNLLGFAGWTFSNHGIITTKFSNSKAQKIRETKIKIEKELFNSLKKRMSDDVIFLTTSIKNTANLSENEMIELKASIANDFKRKLDTITGLDPGSPSGLDETIANYTFKTSTSLTEFIRQIKIVYAINKALYSKQLTEKTSDYYNLYSIAHEKFIEAQIPRRLTLFLQGGINARAFTRFLGLSTPDFSASFQDTLYRGGVFGIGANIQYKNFWLGITYSYVDGDNFASLKSKEYTYRITDTSGNQTLLRDKKITAYSGKYSKVETNQLNVDLVGDFRLSDTSRILGNVYLRGSLFSRDTALLKNYINIGAGVYFINKKGKFLGGLYVELPDINNNFEKAKPANEINIRSPFKKLSFGIVTKFTLSSIFGWSNKPAKSD